MVRVCLLSLLCIGSCGCSSRVVAPMPVEYPSLPSASSYAGVWVEARFYTNHAGIFGEDLLRAGYVPVAIRIFTRASESDETGPRMFVDDIQPRLYLPGGGVLELIPYDRMNARPDTQARITDEALDVNIIKPEDQSEEGFIYFQLPVEEFRVVDADTLIHLREPLAQEVKISKSLLALEYFTDEGVLPVFVGLRMDRRLKRD